MKNPFPIPQKIILFVVGLHIAYLAFFFFAKPKVKTAKFAGSLQARHYTLEKERPKKTEPAPRPQKKLAKKEPTKTKSKAPKKETSLASNQPPPKKQKQPLDQTVSKDKEKPVNSSSAAIPLASSAGISQASNEPNYTDKLAKLLQDKVFIKGSGRVQVRLKLDSNGELQKLEVVSASHSDLIGPLEQQIKTLDFPPFDATMKKKKQEAFIFEFFAN